jgi:Ca2+-binding RTX toxin-like protein
MTGGVGHDRFYVEGGDLITDFQRGEDVIDHAQSGFGAAEVAILNFNQGGDDYSVLVSPGGQFLASFEGVHLERGDLSF